MNTIALSTWHTPRDSENIRLSHVYTLPTSQNNQCGNYLLCNVVFWIVIFYVPCKYGLVKN